MNEKNIFRAKNMDTEKWVEGYACKGPVTGLPAIQMLDTLKIVDILPETLGQSSGVCDKKRTAQYPQGQMIFEGDIVSGLFRFGLAFNAVVTFQDGSFGLEWNRNGQTQFCAFTSFCNVEFEVIGNLSDTPELMEDDR